MAKHDKFKVRRWTKADIPALVELHNLVYPDFTVSDRYDSRIFQLELEKFPEGQFLVETEGKVVAYACAIIVLLGDSDEYYTYSEITGGGSFSTHNPSGDTLYGADIAVHPDYRGLGLASLLYKERKKLLTRYHLRRMVAHGRLPGFSEYSGRLTAEEYIQMVTAGQLSDAALKAHLKAGYTVKRVLFDHVVDSSSLNHCTWLEMVNEKYSHTKKRIEANPIKRIARTIRVCAAQYEFRRINDWKEFEDSVEFFLDTGHTYHCHLLVLPELFSAQLFSTFDPSLDDRAAMEMLASYTERFVEFMQSKAKEHSLYVVAGSHPTLRNGLLYNTAYLFSPSGKVYSQDKLHITPAERRYWNIVPGDTIRVFDTPMGRFGILICYDIEFPELARIMVKHGAEVLLVPFSTDERKAYSRVRMCAHARAVENYVYVVIAGNVGNLHNVRSYLLNYGQSAILTPSDLAFPAGAVAAEADPNTESVAIADLDITTLLTQREIGSVRPLYDQRNDLYELKPKVPVEVIRVD